MLGHSRVNRAVGARLERVVLGLGGLLVAAELAVNGEVVGRAAVVLEMDGHLPLLVVDLLVEDGGVGVDGDALGDLELRSFGRLAAVAALGSPGPGTARQVADADVVLLAAGDVVDAAGGRVLAVDPADRVARGAGALVGHADHCLSTVRGVDVADRRCRRGRGLGRGGADQPRHHQAEDAEDAEANSAPTVVRGLAAAEDTAAVEIDVHGSPSL